jgi:hypothetical protein
MRSMAPNSKRTPPDWEQEVKGLLKAELARKGLTHSDLVLRLDALGVSVTKASIDSKLSRGTFSAVFLLQCLRAIGCGKIHVDAQE